MARRRAKAKKKPSPPPPPPIDPVDVPLTPNEQKFVLHYTLTGKKAQSYKVVFPEVTIRSASVLAGRLLEKVNIKAEIAAIQKDRRNQFRAKASKVLAKRAQLAFSDIGDVMDLSDPEYPKLKPWEEIPIEARRAIASIGVTSHGVRVKMMDQNPSLRALEEFFGLSQEITPLDALLAALPPELAQQIRQALAGLVPSKPDPPSAGN